jgi:hypothetical protein
MDKCLLLDFDGVILNNKTVNENLSKRASLFLSENTHLTPDYALKVNRKQYKKYGHTLYLTNEINNKKKFKKKMTIQDFNEYVYTDDFVNKFCLEEIYDNDIVLYKHWNEVIKYVKYKKMIDDVFIFSNAPSIWIESVLNKFEKLTSISLNVENVTSVPEKFDNKLKPDIRPYKQFTQTYKYTNYIFIDDSETNLQYDEWINCLFDPNERTVDRDDGIYVINSPYDLYKVL